MYHNVSQYFILFMSGFLFNYKSCINFMSLLDLIVIKKYNFADRSKSTS